MKTHGELRWRPNPASEQAFRDGDAGAWWGLRTAPYITIKVKRLFPRCDPYRDGWVVLRDTPEVCRDLEWLLERYPLEMDARDRGRLTEGAQEHRDTEAAVYEILARQRRLPENGWLEVDPGRERRDYQYVAADLAIRTGRLLLVDELGLGKSHSCLLALRDPRFLPALVVCQTHLTYQWEAEIHATFPGLRTHVVRRMEPYDPRDHRSMRGHDPDVLIVPYSKMRGWGHHLASRVNGALFDEIQELRVPGSQKYRACLHVALHCDLRVGATATPVYNYAGEIHTLFEVLAPGELGTRDEFTREWSGHVVQTIGNDHVAVGDPGALGVYLRDQGLMLRRTRKDVGRELPEVVRVTHSIETDDDLLDGMIEDAADLPRSSSLGLVASRGSRAASSTGASAAPPASRRPRTSPSSSSCCSSRRSRCSYSDGTETATRSGRVSSPRGARCSTPGQSRPPASSAAATRSLPVTHGSC